LDTSRPTVYVCLDEIIDYLLVAQKFAYGRFILAEDETITDSSGDHWRFQESPQLETFSAEEEYLAALARDSEQTEKLDPQSESSPKKKKSRGRYGKLKDVVSDITDTENEDKSP
jgi:hypothetical protein